MLNTNGDKSPIDLMNEDLEKSGLETTDMLTRVIDEATRSAIGLNSKIKGYVIPYFDMFGKIQTFYRIKILNPTEGGPKYLQVKNSPNHIYFPKNFMEIFHKSGRKVVVITEGEKKAALLCKSGIPCVGLGGVDSWRNKIIFIPKTSEVGNVPGNSTMLQVKLPSHNFDENMMSPLAKGLQELINLTNRYGSTVIIVFDTDGPSGLTIGPQRSAARLGFELRQNGFTMSRVRQLILPHFNEDIVEKVALDDFIMHQQGGIKKFIALVQHTLNKRHAFPRHPNIREHIGKMLTRGKLDRRQVMNLGLSIITELDSRGMRMYSPDDLQHYYFNQETKELMKVDINKRDRESVHESDFGKFLYREFNIAPAADTRIMNWLGAQFAAEDPVEVVHPHRLIARHQKGEDVVRYQVNNSQYIKVSGSELEPFAVLPNGGDKILFQSEIENGIEGKLILDEAKAQLEKYGYHPPFWWHEVIKEVRLKNPGKQAIVSALLFYISPFLFRWRGTQLPVELIVGEAGTGKSTLCEIRLTVLAGDPKLRNTPGDYKDWHASIANSGGLHVTDNVHMTDKTLKQRISDDLCRLVTEPDPKISMRKYFTEADERSIRISNVFAFTAIQQPFPNSDLLQRSMLLELSKPIQFDENGQPTGVDFDSYWKSKQISRFGGRAAWLAHHMHVLHCFFRKVEKEWDTNYKSRNRLVNLEQIMVMMGEILGVNDIREWLPGWLAGVTNEAISKADWALEGLAAYAEYVKRRYHNQPNYQFSVQEIANWAMATEAYESIHLLTNSRSLGHYMQTNKHNIAQIAGIVEDGKKNNKLMYRVTGKLSKEEVRLLAKDNVKNFKPSQTTTAGDDANVIDMS